MVIHLLQQAVQEAGTTVIAATHDVDLAGAADARLTLPSLA
jgi:ABC-type lipoprotein export system ATPase subunit